MSELCHPCAKKNQELEHQSNQFILHANNQPLTLASLLTDLAVQTSLASNRNENFGTAFARFNERINTFNFSKQYPEKKVLSEPKQKK